MKTPNDPRGALLQGGASATAVGSASYAHFYAEPPQETTASARYWYARGQNFLVVHVEASAGECFRRAAQIDEFALVVLDEGVSLEARWNGERVRINSRSLSFIPPGDSEIVVEQGGNFCLVFTTRSTDLCAKCSNADTYSVPSAHVSPLVDWPQPTNGWKLRTYAIDVPDEEGRFGRIWRCTTLMLNIVPESFWLRGPTRLSPHHHDAFEQGSLVLQGSFTHHLRWPWSVDRTTWREDEHEHCGAPSLAVIPPKVIHTSEGMPGDPHVIVDVFSPPREDFSLKRGWVLNEQDYPMPSATSLDAGPR
jgi:hypothetical protein